MSFINYWDKEDFSFNKYDHIFVNLYMWMKYKIVESTFCGNIGTVFTFDWELVETKKIYSLGEENRKRLDKVFTLKMEENSCVLLEIVSEWLCEFK